MNTCSSCILHQQINMKMHSSRWLKLLVGHGVDGVVLQHFWCQKFVLLEEAPKVGGASTQAASGL